MSTDNSFENVPEPEEEPQQIEQLAEVTVALLDMRYEGTRILRGVHPKSHGCVRAYFEIREDVPEHLRVGMFASPGRRYGAWVRYSNASGTVAPDLDGAHGSRGMAIKVLDVEGEVLNLDGARPSQDFLMINQPSFAFSNVRDYLRLNRVLLKFKDDARPFFAPLPDETEADKARRGATLGAIGLVRSMPVDNPVTVAYFGAAPFMFGPDRVMRFSVEPWGGGKPQSLPVQLSEADIEAQRDDYLRDALRETMLQRGDVSFDFRIQVRGPDDGDLQIEDAHSVWDESETPWVNVARLVIPGPQRRIDAARNEERCERFFFTPWHCLADHKPIGGINRLREAVYKASAKHRQAGNFRRRSGGKRRQRKGKS